MEATAVGIWTDKRLIISNDLARIIDARHDGLSYAQRVIEGGVGTAAVKETVVRTREAGRVIGKKPDYLARIIYAPSLCGGCVVRPDDA